MDGCKRMTEELIDPETIETVRSELASQLADLRSSIDDMKKEMQAQIDERDARITELESKNKLLQSEVVRSAITTNPPVEEDEYHALVKQRTELTKNLMKGMI